MEKISNKRRNSIFTSISTKRFDLVLLAHCFVTGLIDAFTFNNWSVFVGGQTGNTVILALSTAGLPLNQPWSWLTTLVSITSYLLGSFITARLSHRFVPTCRITITTNLMVQGILILVAAAIVTAPHPFIPIDDHDGYTTARKTLADPRIVSVIPLLAFQGGAQITTSRMLGFEEIPVNVVTSTYAGLVSDMDLFKWDNIKRNRRIGAIVLLLAGAACAAWIMKMRHNIVLCLWIGGFIKMVVALCVGIFAPMETGVL